jgi:hypothetical protein
MNDDADIASFKACGRQRLRQYHGCVLFNQMFAPVPDMQ